MSAARDSGVIAGGVGGALDSEQDVVTSSMQHDDERQTPLVGQSVRPAVNAKWSAVRPRVTPRRRAVGPGRPGRPGARRPLGSTRRLSKHAAD